MDVKLQYKYQNLPHLESDTFCVMVFKQEKAGGKQYDNRIHGRNRICNLIQRPLSNGSPLIYM